MLKIPVVTKEVTVTDYMNNFFFFFLSVPFSLSTNTCILGELCKEGKRVEQHSGNRSVKM